VIVISRMLLVQHKARREMEALAERLGDANEKLRAQAAEIEQLARPRSETGSPAISTTVSGTT